MAETERDAEIEAARLEAALTRIARARPPASSSPQPKDASSNPELHARLDALIADLRATLGRDSSD